MDRKSMQEQIRRSGRLPGGKAYWSLSKSVFRRPKVTKAGNRVGSTASALTATGAIGDEPNGYGKGFHWDRKDDAILLAAFINAADPLGVSIGGVQGGDRIQLSSAAGISSFLDDKGSPLASSIVGLLAAGANVGALLIGQPELVPLIAAGESFAKEQFKPTEAKHKRRDAFGIDPATGQRARQEGGVLVSLPEANGPSYSGDSDHEERWIAEPGTRHDANRPAHIRNAFFPIQGEPAQNGRTAAGSGELYITPWDWTFDDNAGYYKVFVIITKSGTPPATGVERIE